jgi:hypothetical protein
MKRFSLINLGLVFVLCFGVASASEVDNVGSTNAEGSTAAGSASLTEDVVKQLITKREENLTKSSTGPKSITVTFESIRFGQSRRANEQDKIDGIPTQTVYPVRVKYTAVHQYANEDQSKEHHYNYNFYEDSYGEWAALGVGPVR